MPPTPAGSCCVPDARARRPPPPDAPYGHAEAWLHALPGGGRAYIDRPLPFLVLGRDDTGDGLGLARRIATISPSNIAWAALPGADASALQALHDVLARQRAEQRQFLLLTLYDLPVDPALDESSTHLERFRFVLDASADPPAQAAARCLGQALGAICIDLRQAEVEHVDHAPEAPPHAAELEGIEGVSRIALGLPQIHRMRGHAGRVYPQIRDQLEAAAFDAVLQACAAFVRAIDPTETRHHRAFGRSRLVDAALDIDRALAGISRSFDFLLGVSPINTADAFDQFLAGKCARAPTFRYRPLTVSPVQAKRALYEVDVHAAEDPVLESLFEEKRRELDLQLLMLQHRNTPAFRHASLLLYGPVQPDLLALARDILQRVQPGTCPVRDATAVDCHAVAQAGRALIARYRRAAPGFEADVELRPDIGMGLMVSGQCLLVGTQTRMPRGRLDALLQHEVGVHVLTAVNGNRQPLGIFGAGLADYEGLQEGLGVFAEFLVDGLTDARLRLLAARVLVVDAMLAGQGFVDCYRSLVDEHAFGPRSAFNIVARIFRSGGLSKDAIYLRGLRQVVARVSRGEPLDPLWFGKIAEHHVPVVQELLARGLLRAPLVTPEFLARPTARRQLERIRAGTDLIDLVLEPSPC